MPIEIRMPALSPTMTEGNLARWLKHEGDRISAGEVIAEIETDKATMEIEAVEEGKLGKILIAEDWYSYGVTAEIAATIQDEAFDYLDAPVQRVAGLEVPLPYAKDLSAASKPSANSLIHAIKKVMEGKKR